MQTQSPSFSWMEGRSASVVPFVPCRAAVLHPDEPPLMWMTNVMFLFTGDSTGLIAPTSAGLSEFLLDTYDQTGSGQRSGDDSLSRLPRYGAFVFGDRIPLNITVDWDRVRERPELLGMALQIASENIPAEGGEFDLKVLSLACCSWGFAFCSRDMIWHTFVHHTRWV